MTTVYHIFGHSMSGKTELVQSLKEENPKWNFVSVDGYYKYYLGNRFGPWIESLCKDRLKYIKPYIRKQHLFRVLVTPQDTISVARYLEDPQMANDMRTMNVLRENIAHVQRVLETHQKLGLKVHDRIVWKNIVFSIFETSNKYPVTVLDCTVHPFLLFHRILKNRFEYKNDHVENLKWCSVFMYTPLDILLERYNALPKEEQEKISFITTLRDLEHFIKKDEDGFFKITKQSIIDLLDKEPQHIKNKFYERLILNGKARNAKSVQEYLLIKYGLLDFDKATYELREPVTFKICNDRTEEHTKKSFMNIVRQTK